MILRTQLVVLIGLAVLLGAGWYALNGSEVGAQPKNAPRAAGGGTRVLVEKAPAATDKIIVRAVGTGEARKSAALYPKTAGEVVAVSFRSQDRV
ncbi:MAG TPA: hypothetical protein DIW51_16590, partial [Rhodospirillaceae bacterium]|nr:hypothetical protein [Rhodospirillaceae bacterium]